MKLAQQQIEELAFFKRLAVQNRLDELRLDQEEQYPEPEYTVNEIYCSQYATAMYTIKEEGFIHSQNQNCQQTTSKHSNSPIHTHNQTLRNKKSHPTHNPSIKYPLPLAFAYFSSYTHQQLYSKAISVIKNHFQRKNYLNPHIINYNLACLYRQVQDYKKAIFSLQCALKEKPFFQFAVYDYAFLLNISNREKQALQLLKRHLINSPNSKSLSPLSESQYIQSLFLRLNLNQTKIQQKQILKNLNNKKLNLSSYFNLGLFLRQTKNLQKSELIFKQIIDLLDQGYLKTKSQNQFFKFNKKDQTIYFYSKINLSMVYEQKAFKCIKQQNNEDTIRAYKYKSLQVLNSLVSDQIEAFNKYFIFYSKHHLQIKEKKQKLNNQICSQSNNYFFQYNEKDIIKSNRRSISKFKKDKNQTQLKFKNIQNKQNCNDLVHKKIKNNSKNISKKNRIITESEKEELELMLQFNKKYQQKRAQNEKKLKYLLLKDKQLDNVLSNLSKINDSINITCLNSSNLQASSDKPANIDLKFLNSSQLNSSLISNPDSKNLYFKNITFINTLKKQLQTQNAFDKFQEEFNTKKRKYEKEFQNYDLDDALCKIMDKIFSKDVLDEQKKLNTNQNSAKYSKNTKLAEIKVYRQKEKANEKNIMGSENIYFKEDKLKQVSVERNHQRTTQMKIKEAGKVQKNYKTKIQMKYVKQDNTQDMIKVNQKNENKNENRLLGSKEQNIKMSLTSRRPKVSIEVMKQIELQNSNESENKISQKKNKERKTDLSERKIKNQNYGLVNNFRIKNVTLNSDIMNKNNNDKIKKLQERTKQINLTNVVKQQIKVLNTQTVKGGIENRKSKNLMQNIQSNCYNRKVEVQKTSNILKKNEEIPNSNLSKQKTIKRLNLQEKRKSMQKKELGFNDLYKIDEKTPKKQNKTTVKEEKAINFLGEDKILLNKLQRSLSEDQKTEKECQPNELILQKSSYEIDSILQDKFVQLCQDKFAQIPQKKSLISMAKVQNGKDMQKINNVLATEKSIFSTQKIFVRKQKNNIQDIFQSFNPKSNKNILNNMIPPNSLKSSRRNSIDFSNPHSFNIFGQIQQTYQQAIPSQFSNKFDQAAQLEEKGKPIQAFDIYTQLYKKFKQIHLKQMTLLALAFNFQLQKQYDQAQKTYLKCSKFNNAQAFMKLGQLLIRRNRIESGIQNLEKANCIKRFDKQIQTKLVYGYSLKQQTIQKALSLANSILKRDPTNLQILIMTANILQKQAKIKDALQICLAIDKHKQSQFIKHYIGTLYLSQGNVVEAFNFFKSALQIKSNHVPSLIQIGTILSQLKPKEAISILNKALQFQPNNRLALTRLGKIYQSIQQNPQKALQIYRKTLQTRSNYEAYMKIGDCLQKNGSYLQALVNYRQALNLKKSYQAYMKIAEMHEFKKQYRKSVENYQLALDIIPKENKFYQEKKKIMINMATNMLKLQQFDNVISTLESLLQHQQSKQIYQLLGEGYYGKQQYSIALQFYEKANKMESNEDNLQLLEKLALCFDKKQEFNASKHIYQKILQIDPHNIKCMNNYANILLIIGNTNEAFYWYQIMLQNTPKNLQKRIKVADIYSAVGDWSKVQYHLLICYKQKEHDERVLQKLINLYKQKREPKLVAKYQKKLTLLKVHNKKKEH